MTTTLSFSAFRTDASSTDVIRSWQDEVLSFKNSIIFEGDYYFKSVGINAVWEWSSYYPPASGTTPHIGLWPEGQVSGHIEIGRIDSKPFNLHGFDIGRILGGDKFHFGASAYAVYTNHLKYKYSKDGNQSSLQPIYSQFQQMQYWGAPRSPKDIGPYDMKDIELEAIDSFTLYADSRSLNAFQMHGLNILLITSKCHYMKILLLRQSRFFRSQIAT